MLRILYLLLTLLVSRSVLCSDSVKVHQVSNRYNMQFSVNYARFGNMDKNAIIIKNSISKELKHGKISLGLNYGEGKNLREDLFYVNLNGKEYTDFLDLESMIYTNFLYSIRPINSKFVKLYFGAGPAIGLFSKKYYQFWYKENDVEPYVFLMGEYQNGFDFGLSIDLQLLVKVFKGNSLVLRGGFDSFTKYQSLFYLGVGFQFH